MNWVGPATCRLAVVAERMPFQITPFEGAAGAMFQSEMTTTGIGVGKVAFGFADTHLEAALSGLGAKFVLLAGDGALSLFRPDLRVRQCHGRPMLIAPGSPVILYPMFHPEAYHRNPRWRGLMQHELRVLMGLGSDSERWSEHCPQTCVKCRGPQAMTDPQGVVYCESHLP